MNEREVQPIYLLADSQPLFWKSPAGPFFASMLEAAGISEPRVAYIGASNGDSPEAHSIFAAAAEQLGSSRRHHVRAAYSTEDRVFLEHANVVVLAGGDVEAGWNAFTQSGMRKQIESLYRKEGAVLIGVSAGAVQCGKHAALAGESGASRLIETFGFVPFIVDVHDEKREWQTLSGTIRLLENGVMGVGIPSGGGLAVHADGTLEPIRRGVDQFVYSEGKLRHSLLMPDDAR